MLGVEGRRRRHSDNVHRVEECSEIAERPSAQGHSHGRRSVWPEIKDAGQHDTRKLSELARVVAAEYARADHAAPQRLSHSMLRLVDRAYQVTVLDATRPPS